MNFTFLHDTSLHKLATSAAAAASVIAGDDNWWVTFERIITNTPVLLESQLFQCMTHIEEFR